MKNIIYTIVFLTFNFEINAENNSLIIQGYIKPKYKNFDNSIIKFMKKRGFKGATLAIMYKGKFVAQRGYGWSDKDLKNPMMPNTKMRIASLSKIFTTVAIKKLVEKNKISLLTKALEFLSEFKSIKDKDTNNITIQNLLDHTAGWDSSVSYDPLFFTRIISKEIKKDYKDITPNDIINYFLSNSTLQFKPGTQVAYSNFGFLLLGRIIEKASNKKYINFIKDEICKPLNVNIELVANNIKNESRLKQVYYKINGPIEPGTFILEASDSAFGLESSAIDLCRFLKYYWIDGDKRKKNQSRQYVQTGSLPGLTALARQRYSGATIVVLINSRDDNNWENDTLALKNLIDNTANKSGI